MIRRVRSLLAVLVHLDALIAAAAFMHRDISSRVWADSTIDFSSSPEAELLHSSIPRGGVKSIFGRRYRCLVLNASTSGNRGGKKGYRFGDITKSLIGGSVEKITGKPYEFGDLSKAIDSSIKERINDLTGNDDYEFGDLSRWVDTKIKGEVNKFTDKESYQFGDLTKEILRRVASGKYTLNDLFMLLKGLSILGASISPVAGFLPVKLLVELLNFSLLNDVAGKVTSSLAMELDKRLKKSLLGDENYRLGDATKRTIAGAVRNYTGKDKYEFGDVTKKVVSGFADEEARVSSIEDRRTFGTRSSKDMEPGVIEALDKWNSISDQQLKDSIGRIEAYVDLVEKEQWQGAKKNG